jgi:hypothetical protein
MTVYRSMVTQQWAGINANGHMLPTFQAGKDTDSTIEVTLVWHCTEETQRIDGLSNVELTELSNSLSDTNQILEQASIVRVK